MNEASFPPVPTAAQGPTAPEQLEGLDEKDTSWGEYPLDELRIRHENRTIFDVLRRIKQGRYVMDPDFQRDFIWPEDKQSKLIESVVMRIPLPVFYLAEDDAGRMVVVDGLQRLSTFQRYGPNDARKVRLRFQRANRMLAETLGACAD